MWDVKDSTGKNEQTESNEGAFSSVTLYCTAGFGCLVIGNVLPGDSYHSCLSETGTLMACGDGCLKFSGAVCCWLRLLRSGIMSATGHVPGRLEGRGCGSTTWLLLVFHLQRKTGITWLVQMYWTWYSVMKIQWRQKGNSSLSSYWKKPVSIKARNI